MISLRNNDLLITKMNYGWIITSHISCGCKNSIQVRPICANKSVPKSLWFDITISNGIDIAGFTMFVNTNPSLNHCQIRLLEVHTPHSNHTWWRHQLETFSALLELCEGNLLVTCGFPSQSTVTRRFDVFFDLRLSKKVSKHSRRRWFETALRSLWCHCDDILIQSMDE